MTSTPPIPPPPEPPPPAPPAPASPPMGRRERKKAATRKAIADAALSLFMKRDFDDVSIKEIADLADVSPTTVFAHFPRKEALVFDEDDAIRDGLVGLVRDRPARTSIPEALREGLNGDGNPDPEFDEATFRRFTEMIEATPSLRAYQHEMWLRNEGALSQAIAEELELGAPTPEISAYTHLLLSAREFVGREQGSALGDSRRAWEAVFNVLDAGWQAVAESARRAKLNTQRR